MRSIVFLAILLSSIFSAGQTRYHPGNIPGKDHVMIIDRLEPGHSKHYYLKTNFVTCTISSDNAGCEKINVTFNSRTLLAHLCLPKQKSFDLKLPKETNILVLGTDRRNAVDSAFATILLSGDALNYMVKVLCRKNINDTIFLNRQ